MSVSDDDDEVVIVPCCGQNRDYCDCPQFVRDKAMIKALAEAEEHGE